jgi:hypothetical protein
LKCLRHPPYSPDLAPTDYHFFRNFDNFLQGKKLNSDGAVQIAIKDFIDSRPDGFFSKVINQSNVYLLRIQYTKADFKIMLISPFRLHARLQTLRLFVIKIQLS